MKALHLPGLSAAISALFMFAAGEAGAKQRPVGGGARTIFQSHSNHFAWERGHGLHGGFLIVEREVPVIIERETPPAPAAVPLPDQAQAGAKAAPRKPYVVGGIYASLPAGCMKLIEEGVSYYLCSGEWYRQMGSGSSATYKAVARKL